MNDATFKIQPDEPISILMPLLDEEDIIENVILEWIHEVIDYLPRGSEILLNDSSTDGSSAIIENLQKRFSCIHRLSTKREGFVAAARQLYMAAENEYIFFTDSDGQYVPEDFWVVSNKMFENPNSKPDLVHGYKVNRSDPFYRILGSRLFNIAASIGMKKRANDINSAFRLTRKSLVLKELSMCNKIPMLINAEIYLRMNAKNAIIIDAPVRHRSRPMGLSKSLPLQRYFKSGFMAMSGLVRLMFELYWTRKLVNKR